METPVLRRSLSVNSRYAFPPPNIFVKKEFRLLGNIISKYLPPEYPYDVVGGQRNIKQADFDNRIDVVPVADPNIFSMSQRITLAQTQLQLATSNPQLHNLFSF